jgi:two-component system chemotaxis response regulator CheY
VAKIAIIDDAIVVHVMFEHILTKAGHEVVAKIDDATTAAACVEETRPDIVLLDLNMQGVNGMDTLQEIKTINQQIKVIVCTAKRTPEIQQRVLQLGADGYIVKPVIRADLLEAIDRCHL